MMPFAAPIASMCNHVCTVGLQRSFTIAYAMAILTLMSLAAQAELPTWTRTFPPGGQLGQTVEVTVNASFPNGVPTFWANEPGLDWKPSEAAGKYQVSIASDAIPGVRYVRAFDSLGATSLQRFVIGSLPEVTEQKPNQSVKQIHAIAQVPCVVNGVLDERGDVDHFGVRVLQGQTLVASVMAERLLASPIDACLQIVTPSGHVLAQNLDASGLDPELTWTATQDSDVIVRVFGFPATPDSSITLAGGEMYFYRLTLVTGPFVTATMPLAVSSTTPTELRLIGHNLATPAVMLPVPALNEVSTYRFSSTDFVSSITLPVLADAVLVTPEPGEDGRTHLKVPVPCCVSGQLRTARQQDRFEFMATKGTRLAIRIESRKLGYPLDGLLQVEDAKGTRLAESDDADQQPDPQLVWAAPDDGTYAAVVSDLNGFFGSDYVYRLTIRSETSEYSATVTGDLFAGEVGKAIEIPIKVERLGGFSSAIEFSIDGPPAAIRCEPVTSEAEGETSKSVTLKVNAEMPFNGPIRVVSRPKGSEGAFQSVAITGPSITGALITDVWLTIQAVASSNP